MRRLPALSLTMKLTLLMTFLVIAGVGSVTLLSIQRERISFRADLEEQANAQLDSLSVAGSDLLYRLQLSGLQNLINSLSAKQTINTAWVYDSTGHLLVTKGTSSDYSVDLDPFGSKIVGSNDTVYEWQNAKLVAGKAVSLGRQIIGAFGIELSTASLETKLASLRDEGLSVALFASLVALIIAIGMSRTLTEPLRVLTTATQQIAQGDLSHTIAVTSNDEISVLARAFNAMTIRLQETVQGLQQRTHELQLSEIELRKSKEIAEAANYSKSAFLASMSHELRTPLNAVLGFASILHSGMVKDGAVLSPSQLELLKKIELNGRHLRDLINDVLDLAKIESGRMTVTITEDRPETLLNNTVDAMRSLAINKGLELNLVFLQDAPEVVLCDTRKLQQIVTNLIGNAIKFTAQGEVCVEVGASGLDYWQIAVRDTGIGIPEDAREHIFDKFQQVDTTDRREYEGTGLGLAIVKGLIETLQGTVKVQSALGNGSTFVVRLPQRLDRRGV